MSTLQTVRFTLNGTDINPWHRMGLTQNPFPQIGKAEYDHGCRALNKLGGDPIPPDDAEGYIRHTLAGFKPDFVERVVSDYTAGAIVHISFVVDLETARWSVDTKAQDDPLFRAAQHGAEYP